MDVTIYSKPACVQCTATYRSFDRIGVDYEIVDVTQDEEALEWVSQLGYLQAPVVVVLYKDNSQEHWSGFQPDKIKDLVLWDDES